MIAHSRSNGAAAKEKKVAGDDGSHGGAMAGTTGSRRYGAPVRKRTKKRHGKGRELTVSRFERSAVSGEAPKWVVDGGGGYREREDARVSGIRAK